MKAHSLEIAHGIPTSEQDLAEQNFLRGKIAAFEDFVELAEDYRQWKESK